MKAYKSGITYLVSTLALTLLCLSNVMAQITIAPTNLFIDSGNKFGSYLVINNSNEPYEVTVDFLFGYGTSDDEGNRFMTYDDSIKAAQYSIADWIRAFPQNLTLAPNKRQVIRLRVAPPADLADGTYWARIVTSATPQSQPLEIQNQGAVTANIGMKVNQITGIYYKNGQVNTSIGIDKIDTEVSNDSLLVIHNVTRGGNSPFLGSINVRVYDNKNKLVLENIEFTSIYFDTKLKHEFDISDLESGQYNIEISIASDRQDISKDDLVQMNPVSATTTVIIP